MSMPRLRLLLIDDSKDDADLVLREVRRAFDVAEYRRVDSAGAMRRALQSREWDIAILDFSLPGFDAMEALEIAQEQVPNLPCIIVSGVIDTGAAVEAMRAGVRDYLMKDDLVRLAPAIARELDDAEARRERRGAERALRESEDRYRTVVEASQDGILVEDMEQRVIFANQAALEMLGYSLDELRTLDPRQLVHPDDAGQLADWRRNMDSNEASPRRYVGKRVRRDGSAFLAEVSVAPLVNEGETTGAVVNVRDVTERVKAEAALRASEEKYRSLVGAMPDFIIRLARDGTYLDFHPGALAPYVAPEEYLGKRLADVTPPDLAARAMTAVARALDTREPQIIEHQLGSDGSKTEWESRFVPLSHDEVLIIARDMTDQVRLKEQLLVAQKSEALGTLVAGVAHDFNNLLTGIGGSIELARMKPEERKWLDGAETATRRAAELIRKLLQFSRREPPARVAVDLRDIADETVTLAREMFDRRVTLEIDRGGPVPPVSADPGQIEQVLMNLLVNALDAVEERARSERDRTYRPQIRVTIHVTAAATATEVEPRQDVVMSVIDNGVGISPDVRKRIFDPFFTTKDVGRGTGLGLSTAYGIVAEHGGSIEVTSTPGAGSTFAVVLPVGATGIAGIASSSAGDGAASPPEAGGGGAVLVVDDEPLLLAAAERALIDAGYQVVAAAGGVAALRAVQEQTFHVAVVDVSMPVPDGWDVLSQIRDMAPETKVFMTSGYALEDETAERGGYAFIAKPYTLNQLVAAVDAVRRDVERARPIA